MVLGISKIEGSLALIFIGARERIFLNLALKYTWKPLGIRALQILKWNRFYK